MIIFPAVDLKNGRAVRLKQGRADAETIFSDTPVDAALSWQKAGAEWLHLIDLDGAFDGEPKNRGIIEEICSALKIPVQLGGGIRDLSTARAYIKAGVRRLIIGTMALEEPDNFAALCREFPGRVGVSLDAENGRLKTRGWVGDGNKTVDEVLPGLLTAGAAFVIYTDIERDGMQSGVNAAALAHLCAMSSAPVIAAGGVASLEDVEKLFPLSVSGKLEGVISGRALYEGTLDLAEAMKLVNKLKKQA